MTEFQEIEGLDGVYAIHKGNLRSIAIALKDKSVCVVSPISGLPKSAYESLEAIGPVRHVLAPNHYHNKGIAEFAKIYPKIKAYASESATARLLEQTGVRFGPLGPLKKLLSKGTSILKPAGLKTGEVWLRFTNSELTAWMVVDAFCGPKLKKLATEAKSPELLKTFPNYGIADKAIYSSWVDEQVQKDAPTLLIPCHGSVVRSPGLAKSLTSLAKQLNK